jgi:hypothetical protein
MEEAERKRKAAGNDPRNKTRASRRRREMDFDDKVNEHIPTVFYQRPLLIGLDAPNLILKSIHQIYRNFAHLRKLWNSHSQ